MLIALRVYLTLATEVRVSTSSTKTGVCPGGCKQPAILHCVLATANRGLRNLSLANPKPRSVWKTSILLKRDQDSRSGTSPSTCSVQRGTALQNSVGLLCSRFLVEFPTRSDTIASTKEGTPTLYGDTRRGKRA